MGFDAEYPPYTYMGDDGEYTGFDIEMCKKVCEKLGWELELVPINWDTKLMTLDMGEIDCIWSGLTIDVIDPEAYCLSTPYSDNSQMILTRADAGITTLSDLAGKKVAVQLGTSADLLLQGDQKALAGHLRRRRGREAAQLQRLLRAAGSRARWTPSLSTSAWPPTRSPSMATST